MRPLRVVRTPVQKMWKLRKGWSSVSKRSSVSPPEQLARYSGGSRVHFGRVLCSGSRQHSINLRDAEADNGYTVHTHPTGVIMQL
jgi:hypothetical protein